MKTFKELADGYKEFLQSLEESVRRYCKINNRENPFYAHCKIAEIELRLDGVLMEYRIVNCDDKYEFKYLLIPYYYFESKEETEAKQIKEQEKELETEVKENENKLQKLVNLKRELSLKLSDFNKLKITYDLPETLKYLDDKIKVEEISTEIRDLEIELERTRNSLKEFRKKHILR